MHRRPLATFRSSVYHPQFDTMRKVNPCGSYEMGMTVPVVGTLDLKQIVVGALIGAGLVYFLRKR